MKKPFLSHAIIAAALLGLAGAVTADEKKTEQPPTKALDQATEGQVQPGAGQTTGAETPATKTMDKAAAGQTEQDKAGGVKVQDYSKAGAYSGGKPVGAAGRSGETVSDQPASEKGSTGRTGDPSEQKSGEQKK